MSSSSVTTFFDGNLNVGNGQLGFTKNVTTSVIGSELLWNLGNKNHSYLIDSANSIDIILPNIGILLTEALIGHHIKIKNVGSTILTIKNSSLATVVILNPDDYAIIYAYNNIGQVWKLFDNSILIGAVKPIGTAFGLDLTSSTLHLHGAYPTLYGAVYGLTTLPVGVVGEPGSQNNSLTFLGYNAGLSAFNNPLLSSKCLALGNGVLGGGGIISVIRNLIASGFNAGFNLNIGIESTISGTESTNACTDLRNSNIIGHRSAFNTTSIQDCNIIGYLSCSQALSLKNIIAIGTLSLSSLTVNTERHIAIGTSTLLNYDGTLPNLGSNLAIGHEVLFTYLGQTGGYGNASIGDSSCGGLASGNSNTVLGTYAFNAGQNANDNTFIGSGCCEHTAGYSSGPFTCIDNVSIGVNTTDYIKVFQENVAIGNKTGYNLGQVTINASSITQSVLIGHNVTPGLVGINLNFTNNTCVGHNSGQAIITESAITLLGNQTNIGLVGISNATAIGPTAIVNGSNTIQLGNSNVKSVNSNGSYIQVTQVPAIYTISSTLVASQLLDRIHVCDSLVTITLTTPTAAQIVSAIPGAIVGSTIRVDVISTTSLVNFSLDTGVTMPYNINITAAQRTVIFRVTNVTPTLEAVEIY